MMNRDPLEMHIVVPKSKRGKRQNNNDSRQFPANEASTTMNSELLGHKWYRPSSIIEHRNLQTDRNDVRISKQRRQTYYDSSEVFPLVNGSSKRGISSSSTTTQQRSAAASGGGTRESWLTRILNFTYICEARAKLSLLKSSRRNIFLTGIVFIGFALIINLASEGLALSQNTYGTHQAGDDDRKNQAPITTNRSRIDNDNRRQQNIEHDKKKQIGQQKPSNVVGSMQENQITTQTQNIRGSNGGVQNNQQQHMPKNGGGYVTDSGEIIQSQQLPKVKEVHELPPQIEENINIEEKPEVNLPSTPSQENPTAEVVPPSDTAVPSDKEDLQGISDSIFGFLDGIFDQAPIEDIPSYPEEEESVENSEEPNENETTPTKQEPNEPVEEGGLIGIPEVKADGSIPLRELSNFKDTAEPWDKSDVPIFLHIPKAGGSTVKDILGTCHRFVMATEKGILDGHGDDADIAIVYPGGGPVGQDRSPFVNVDTTTISGIARARAMNFADSGLADAVVTPFIFETNALVTPTAKGRLFTVFRHPIERAISMFYYIQVADWEPTYDPELKFWTFEQYAESSKVENNWLTRQLSNQPEGDLTEKNVNIAKEIIRRRFLVGLVTDMRGTVDRFEKFFKIKYRVNPPNQEKCRETLLDKGANSNGHTARPNEPEPGSKEWKMLEWQNQYDLKLYEFIEALYIEQGQLVADVPDDFRNIDATCCKCGPPTFPPEGFNCPMSIMN